MFKEDDWLEEEIRYESKLSPWRFDSTAADIRIEHEENCDAEGERRSHIRQHRSMERKLKRDEQQINSPRSSLRMSPTPLKGFVFSIFFITMIFILFVFLIVFNDMPSGFPFVVAFIPFVFFIIIVSAISNTISKNRR